MPSIMQLSNELGAAALRRNDYKEAIKQFRYMLKESRKHGEVDQASAWNHLATAYTRDRRYKEADEAFRACLELNERVYGQSHPTVGVELNNLAFVVWKGLNDKVQAKALIDRSVQIGENSTQLSSEATEEHIDHFAESLENLAILVADEGDRVSAEKMLRLAVKLKADLPGIRPASRFRPVLKLIEFLDKQGRSQESKEILENLLPKLDPAEDNPPYLEAPKNQSAERLDDKSSEGPKSE